MEITFKSDIDVELIQSTGGDEMVIAAARVSTDGTEARNVEEIEGGEHEGLIRYLMRHRHGTPFEHASLTFFVNGTGTESASPTTKRAVDIRSLTLFSTCQNVTDRA